MTKKCFLESERTAVIVCGREGSGKSTVISSILRTNKISATWVPFQDLKTLTAVKPHLVITNILQSPTGSNLNHTIDLLISSTQRLTTLILEVTLSSSHDTLSSSHHTLMTHHDTAVYYVLSPAEISCPPNLPPNVIPVSVDVSRSREWQVAAHVFRAYRATPDTFSALSLFTTDSLPVLPNKVVYDILAESFPEVSTRTLWYIVKMLVHVVERAITRLGVIRQDFGNMLDVYTKNVGLMIANQIEQVVRLFSGEFDPSQMFAVFPELAPEWQLVECNRTSPPSSPCQAHLQKLLSECSEHYYKHLDIDIRLKKLENDLVTRTLDHILGCEAKESVRGLAADNKVIMSPPFFVLVTQMIYKIKLNIPVILVGEEGSGRSTLVRCLKELHRMCGRNCLIVYHDPVLQTEPELLRGISSSGANSESDTILLVVQVSQHCDVCRVHSMVHGRTIAGQVCPPNVKFMVEISDETCRRFFDRRCVTTVKLDQIVVREMLEDLGLPAEIHNTILPILSRGTVSYRNVINFSKVYSWLDQVFCPKHSKLLLTIPLDDNSGQAITSAGVLLLTVDSLFGPVTDDMVEHIVKCYNVGGGSCREDVLCFTLDYVVRVLFGRCCSSKKEFNRALFLTLLSLETGIPVVLSCNTVSHSALQDMLNSNTLTTLRRCNTVVLNNTATPFEVLQCYWQCLKEQIASAKESNTFVHGVLICHGYEAMSPESQRVLSQLVKCKPARPQTPDISVIILVEGETVPRELGCCLLDIGLKRENQLQANDLSTDKVVLVNHDKAVSDSNYGDDKVASDSEDGGAHGAASQPTCLFQPSDPLTRWIVDNVHIGNNNVQIVASARMIVKLLLKQTDSYKSLPSRLEKICVVYGDVLSFLCKLPPIQIYRASSVAKMTDRSVLSHLIETRLGAIASKEMLWSNAYTFTTELRTLYSYIDHHSLRRTARCLLWFCEMSAVFCTVKDASLSQYLTVVGNIVSGSDCSYTLFSSWLHPDSDSRTLPYFLLFLIPGQYMGSSVLMRIVREVVERVKCLDTLCLLCGTIARVYGIDTLDELCDDVHSISSNTPLLSALVIVYQDELTETTVTETTVTDSTLPSGDGWVSVKGVALIRQTVKHVTQLLVEYYHMSAGDLTTVDVIEKFFRDRDEYSSFSLFNKLISEPSNVEIRRFVLALLLDKAGTGCLKYFLSALPILQHDTVESGETIDLSRVIPGYGELRDLITPICTLCSAGGWDRENTRLYAGVAPLLYYEATQDNTKLQCDCLKRLLPPLVRPLFSIIHRSKFSLGAGHTKVALYLISLLSPQGNPFMRYFLDLLTHPELGSIYWMGMPHDDIFDIINTVRPSEKYAGVEKEFAYYQCPNGHVYSINNCGDPLQKSKCPECKTIIGGKDHIAEERNSKYDRNQKQRIETGYTLKCDEYKPGLSSIRSLSQVSTAILWYLTHSIVSMRSSPFLPPDYTNWTLKDRLDSAFSSISDKLGISRDETVMFILDVVNKLNSYSSTSLKYNSEIVHDSLAPQDTLIMNKNEDIKVCRRLWETEFSDVVAKLQENVTFYRDRVTNSSSHKWEELSTFTDKSGGESNNVTSIGHPSYWERRRAMRNPFRVHPDTSRTLEEEEWKLVLLKKFGEEQENLHLLHHLPFLLTLVQELKQELNYRLDLGTLSEPATPTLGRDGDVRMWYDVWRELDSIYPVGDIKLFEELALFDIIPTSCGSGTVTLNMIEYLSALQNRLLPDTTPASRAPPDKYRLLEYDRDTTLPFLCEETRHLSNLLHHHYLGPLSKLPTDHHNTLQSLRLRAVYGDVPDDDREYFVKFYNEQDDHVELGSGEVELLERVGDVWECHKVVTGIIVGLGDRGEVRLGDGLASLGLSAGLEILLGQTDKLFAVYRHVNLLCLRATIGRDQDINTRSTFFTLLTNALLTSSPYTKTCSVPELAVRECQSLLLLILEYVSLRVLYVPPDFLVEWGLREALDFHLDRFKDRDTGVLECLGDEVKVGSAGYLLRTFISI